jgi:peptidoglycan hydrolase-like protein with peptidoglycan-binding domain
MNQNDQIPSPAGTPAQPSRAALYTSIGAAGLGAAGLVAALVIGVTGVSHAHSANTADHRSSHSAITPIVIPVQPSNGASTGGTGGGTSTPTPSPTIRLLQQQLAQLNYYEGPINGIDSPQVHQAIEYLQRDAHLPQTGILTPATQTALSTMLVNGNSQMGG